jgi:hypothetical protein
LKPCLISAQQMVQNELGMLAQACNPSYSGGKDQEDDG